MKLRLLTLQRTARRALYGSCAVVVMLLISQSREATQLETILANGTLKLVTRQGPITYYEDGRGKNGFDYVLARDFADYLGVELEVVSTESIPQLFNMVGGPNADFAGATLTITPERQKTVRFSRPYADVVQTVIFRRDSSQPKTVADLVGKQLAVVAGSSHEEHLNALKKDYPGLTWLSIDDVEMIELVEMVEAGEINYAIIDSTTFEAHRSMYTRTSRAMDISAPQHLAWAFPAHSDQTLLREANRFLNHIESSGRLKALREQFFADIKNFSVPSAQLFFHRMENRLPLYRQHFETIAREFDMDWHLLAAIAYQESHWNPQAVSPTEVKGMMMLTKEAAFEVGVTDRIDAHQSIRGGTEYFLQTKAKIADDIHEPDRTLFALAAYNVGVGHLEDARVLTERAGKDPHRWDDVKQFLPLLQRKKYYSSVRHGYARGQEPVIYVRNILKYLRMLQWNTIEENRRNERDKKNAPPTTPIWDHNSFRTL